MKKIIFSVVAVAAIAVGYQKYTQVQTMSDLMLANVEALASSENEDCPNGCLDVYGPGCWCYSWHYNVKEAV